LLIGDKVMPDRQPQWMAPRLCREVSFVTLHWDGMPRTSTIADQSEPTLCGLQDAVAEEDVSLFFGTEWRLGSIWSMC